MKDIQNNQLVVKSNRLIEASYRLSLNEQRIILFAISRVRRDRELHLEDVFDVHASDLVSFFGVDPKTAYAELIDVSKTLFTTCKVCTKSSRSRIPPIPSFKSIVCYVAFKYV